MAQNGPVALLCRSKRSFKPLSFKKRKGFVSLGHRLINTEPDACRGEIDDCEEAGVVFLVSGCDGPIVLELRKEPRDTVAPSVGVTVEGRRRRSAWDWADDGLCADAFEEVAQRVTLVSDT